MSRKKWLIAAAILLLTGVLACGIAFVVLGFDFGKLSTVAYVTNTYDVQDSFHSITINADTEKITFVPSEDKKCRVVCREEESDSHKVRVDGDTLIVERENKKQLHFSIGIVTESQEITVYLPEDAYDALSIDSDTGDVSIPKDLAFANINVALDTGDVQLSASAKGDIYVKTNTGHIAVTDVSASGLKLKTDTGKIEANKIKLSGDMDIQVDTGKTILTDISCRNFMSNGDTGDLIMTNVIASGEFSFERSTGDIEFNSCDANTIYVRTNTGDVSGTLLTDKVFITDTDTGRIDVPKTITGGRCEISTDTGDIRLQIQ